MPKQTTAEAFNAFANKLQRFISSGGEEPKRAPLPRSEQERIHDALSEQKKAVISRYRLFLNADASVAADQAELLAAYNLFKAAQEANAAHATESTHLDGVPLVSPLTKNDRYTIGGDFIYLQLWLYHEKQAADYIPLLKPQPEGSESYTLTFVPARHYHPTYDDKEKADVIRACYYAGK